MASKKDMRREDLIIPFRDQSSKEADNDVAGTMASTLPMVAMFTRNKMIGWAAFVFAVQTWLAQTPEQAKKAGTPGYLSAAMACEPSMPNPYSSATNVSCGLVLGLGTTYLPMFMPPPAARLATGTEAPPVAPPS
ncbi:hypothetical protein JMJ35_007287 [Cladonia borealis]|uniref:Uncharacterized protein n=1 Tax=Cladonia borealis TaxID=184061 RepID=A0AA39UZG1_9LECA|nr:hypothetical protein JMJ35_007287 [Cladonia borealis]